ncbi:hypothetical protein GSU75_01558 [Pseudomonas savastanoi pv. phaseolicola]|uniref:hypothetical protein n=1 Tax=Pseudomonas savastanoi TaxID=29438 RepID=UPI00197D870F|nr:hypothetical protein [Pseudomonas savastanoi]MBN4174353.1 hypothetical protein [Pseudomonas savastanoi pv. phaseolicola]
MTNHLCEFTRNDEASLPVSQDRLDGAHHGAWWLDGVDFQRFRRGLYARLLSESTPAGPVAPRKAS